MKNSLGTEQYYPYVGKRGKCAKKENIFTFPGYAYVNKPADIKKAMDVMPIVVAFEVRADMQHYSGKAYKTDDPTCGDKINHFALAVGYHFEDKDTSYYIIKNSFSDQWGFNGYFTIFMTQCGITYNKFNVRSTQQKIETSTE